MEISTHPVKIKDQPLVLGIARDITERKHAFPNGESGKIQVQLNNNLDRYTMVVRDTGVGFPDDVEMGNTETLGL